MGSVTSETEPTSGPSSSDLVQSLVRGLVVLKSFTHQNSNLSVTEVAEKAGLSRAAARRILLTLESMGYVESENAKYHLRPKVLELGYAYLSSIYPWDSALPVLQRLSDSVNENCLAGVLDEQSVVCVARISRRMVSVSVPVGGRMPAHASSMGRVLLANLGDDAIDQYLETTDLRAFTEHTITDPKELKGELRHVRETGWSIVEGELEPEIIGIAAPVFGPSRNAVAAINVTAQDRRVSTDEAISRILPELLECSKEVGLLFGGSPH